jgi:hypothetical protein
LRFFFFLTLVLPCFLLLGIGLRISDVAQKFCQRQAYYSILRLSDKVAVGQPLPLKDKLMARDDRTHVFVIRNEREFWSGADPIDCIDAECQREFGIAFKRPSTALNVFTNVEYIPRAWGIPVIADRWGARPAETFTVVAKGDGIVTEIYRHADIEDLDYILAPTH